MEIKIKRNHINQKTATKLGLFGGSFNPPHYGHLYIASLALKKFHLNSVLWLVTGKNPFKKNLKFLPLSKRIFLSNKLIGKNKRMKAIDFESDLPSFQTFYTIKKALCFFPYSKLYWIIGSDTLFSFHRWKRYDFILSNIRLLVFARDKALKSIKTPVFIKYRSRIEFVWSKKANISSTFIRKSGLEKKCFFYLKIIFLIIILLVIAYCIYKEILYR